MIAEERLAVLIESAIKKVKEDKIEITINFYPDGEIDFTCSPHEPLRYNCPFNNVVKNQEDDLK